MSATGASPSGLEWKFGQVFGEKAPVDEVTEGMFLFSFSFSAPFAGYQALLCFFNHRRCLGLDSNFLPLSSLTTVDIVSAIEFDTTGQYIAAGDRGGRVVIFERNRDPSKCDYQFYCEFQSHEPEFDYLKSLEIEEKINQIKWLKPQGDGLFLLTTNDKTIKLWKVYNKKYVKPVPNKGTSDSLRLPSLTPSDSVVTAAPRRVFASAHTYHINSISLNSDGETFISADDLRINLWNLETRDHCFNIVDIKPPNMEELTEVITAAQCHPNHCNLLIYSSSKGVIKLCDMRQSALCDSHSKTFEEEEDPSNKSFFSEIISSISDVRFSPDGRYILSRDYLTLKIWDVNMDSRPLRTIKIHDHLRSKLCDLYENDCIFDKFECGLSSDGSHLMTGSYNNQFNIYDISQPEVIQSTFIEAAKGSRQQFLTASTGAPPDFNPENIDLAKKCLHVSWHPTDPLVAVAANNNLFLYNAL